MECQDNMCNTLTYSNLQGIYVIIYNDISPTNTHTHIYIYIYIYIYYY